MPETRVEVRSFETTVRDGAFKDGRALGDWMMSYYQCPEPARMLNVFRLVRPDEASMRPNVVAFCAAALEASPDAARFLLKRLPSEDGATRRYGLLVLREAGFDLAPALAVLPAPEQQGIRAFLRKQGALPDTYDLSPSPEDLLLVPNRLDMLWSRFLATGDPRPVRAVAGVLEWAEEGQRFAAQQRSGKKFERITPEVVRGLAYVTAGWSLSSFVRGHGLVADFVEAWRLDPANGPVLRAELAGLLTNPAFEQH